jgi:YD repeat-containing protein
LATGKPGGPSDSPHPVVSFTFTDPNTPNRATAYGYDSNGNLTTLTDANTHTTQNGFDPPNQLNQETMPAGQTQTRLYDAAGNLTSLKDYNGHTTTYTYDTLNRLTQRRVSRTPRRASGRR